MKKYLSVCFEPPWLESLTQSTTYPFAQSLANLGVNKITCQTKHYQESIAKLLSKAGLNRHIADLDNRAYIVGLSWASETKLFPVTYYSEVIPWITDCWEPQFEQWKSIFSRHKIRHVFFSARDAALAFSDDLSPMKSHWLPEAVAPYRFDPSLPLSQRSIDVFEMGRVFSQYNSKITPVTANKYNHIYGKFITEDLATLLQTTKILVCFPKSVTHPEKSGAIETATARYFEGMAAGCLLVGHAPPELIDIFGYNPVIEIEKGNEAQQIQDLLFNIDNSQAIVNRNYQELMKCGTFEIRAQEMLKILNNEGYFLKTKHP
jgi:hypothetical protein